MRLVAVALMCALGVVVSAQEAYRPAVYRSGGLPSMPATAVGGGQVILEVSLDRGGFVRVVDVLRTTSPFTAPVVDAVRGWRFVPAEERLPATQPGEPETRVAIDSRVLVIAVFRPPAVIGPTLGESPKDIARPSAETAFPLSITMPSFPTLASAS